MTPIIHIPETGSTNTDAMARVQAGAGLPFIMYADRQTSGRGRSGRAWELQPGNLAASYALALTCDHQTAAQLSFVAGVAVIDALAPYTDVLATQPKLKWPNDIMIGDAKCGGILIETVRVVKSGCLIAVIGFGLNLVAHPNIEGRKLTHLADHGCIIHPETIVAALAVAMDLSLGIWDEGRGFDDIRARWLQYGLPLGTGMTVHTGRALAEGTFAGLDADGALLMRTKGGSLERHTFGDVSLLS